MELLLFAPSNDRFFPALRTPPVVQILEPPCGNAANPNLLRLTPGDARARYRDFRQRPAGSCLLSHSSLWTPTSQVQYILDSSIDMGYISIYGTTPAPLLRRGGRGASLRAGCAEVAHEPAAVEHADQSP